MGTAPDTHDLYLPPDERLNAKHIQLTAGSGLTEIRGGTIIDGVGGRHERATLVLQGDRVAAIQAARPIDPDAHDVTVIDAAGGTVIPGLIDAHIHFMGAQTIKGR